MLKNLKKSLVVFSAVASMATSAEVTTEKVMPTVEVTTNLLQLTHNVNLGGLFATPYFTVEADLDLSTSSFLHNFKTLAAAATVDKADNALANFALVPRAILGVRHYFNNSCEGFYAKTGLFVGMTTEIKGTEAADESGYETRYTVSTYGGFGHKLQITDRVSMSNSVELSKVWFKSGTDEPAKTDSQKWAESEGTKVATTWTQLTESASFRLLNLEIRVL